MMRFDEFLKLISVIKMLYGTNVAKTTFENNIDKYYDLDSESLLNKVKAND